MNFIALKMLTVTAPNISASFSDPQPGRSAALQRGAVLSGPTGVLLQMSDIKLNSECSKGEKQ